MTEERIPPELKDGLQRLLAGELSYRLPCDSPTAAADSSAATFNSFAEQLQRTIERLQRNEARLSAAIESVSRTLIAVASGDLDARIERDMAGDSLDVLSFLVNSTIDELRLVLEENRRRSEATQRALEGEVQVRTEELFRALTDLREAQREAEAGRDAAEAANRAKSIFLANMSHELRSPLNAILGFTQIMARQSDLPADHRKSLAIVERSGEHLLSLINQILDLSKVESGHMAIDRAPLDLPALLHDVEDMFRPQAADRELQLTFEISGRIPHYIHADEVKLRQILINLLNNAVKFTERGTVSVKLRAERLDEAMFLLHFEVADTGAGIPEEQLPRVFDSFSQAGAGSHQHDGTGLGLTISKRFVELMGGNIQVASAVGRGTRFTFTVECESLVEEGSHTGRWRREKVAKWRRATALAPDQPRYRLLLVDDNPDNIAVLYSLLAPFGFEIRRAENGKEAVGIWQSWSPDLIFMDLRMPVMDGYEATRRIKSAAGGSGEGKRPVVIAVSASSFDMNRQDALAAGCDDHIGKPFRDSEILAALQEYLGVRFLFEEDKEAAPRPRSATTWDDAKRRAMPEVLLKQVEEAIEIGDLVRIESAIGAISPHDAALASRLRALADDLEHDAMLDCIKSYRAPTTDEP